MEAVSRAGLETDLEVVAIHDAALSRDIDLQKACRLSDDHGVDLTGIIWHFIGQRLGWDSIAGRYIWPGG